MSLAQAPETCGVARSTGRNGQAYTPGSMNKLGQSELIAKISEPGVESNLEPLDSHHRVLGFGYR